MKPFAFVLWATALLLPAVAWAQGPARAIRHPPGDVVFHYGIVPAEMVLKHVEPHAERQMHRLRFEARLPGDPRPASVEFEYRVSPEGRR